MQLNKCSLNFLGNTKIWSDFDMQYLADIFSVWAIKDLAWVMRFQSPQVYIDTKFSGSWSNTQIIGRRHIIGTKVAYLFKP